MELICPECRGELQISSDRMASCSLHGGRYEILFDREMEEMAERPAKQPVPTGQSCVGHPRQAAVFACVSCQKALCVSCSYEVAGKTFCSDCAIAAARNTSGEVPPVPPDAVPVGKDCPVCETVNNATAETCSQCGYGFGLLSLTTKRRRSSIPVGLMCAQHNDVQAVATCRICSSGICGTCDFNLPGNMHVCPLCIDKHDDNEISPGRKRKSAWAVAIAAYGMLMLLLLFSGALANALENEGAATLLGNAIFIPALVGTGLGFGAFDRRLRNTAWIWAGVAGNVFVLGVYVILMVIGIVTGAE